jgi:hypothetical protein
MVEEAAPSSNVTVCPTTGALLASKSVTVIVALLTPSAGTLVGVAPTVEVSASVTVGGGAVKFTDAVCVTVTALVVSVAV